MISKENALKSRIANGDDVRGDRQTMNEKNYLGKALRRARVECGMSTEILGACVDRGSKTIEAWEAGRNQPNPEQLMKLCKALDIPITDLFPAEYMPNGNHQLSHDEIELIENYRQMDIRGKATLLVVSDALHPSSEQMIYKYTTI